MMRGIRKNVAPLIAAFFLGVIIAAGPTMQVAAGMHAAEARPIVALPVTNEGSEAGSPYHGPRRISKPDQTPTASLADTQSYEKSLADLGRWRDLLGVVIIGISCVAAVSAGTGGGSIYVPVMTLVMGFSPHASTVMSQSLMCGGVLAGTLLNLCQRHPFTDRPLVDLDLMAGVSLGMVVNQCLPPWLLVTALVVVLSIAMIQTIKQYRRLRRERQMALKAGGSRSPSVSGLERLEGAAAVELVGADGPDSSLGTHTAICTSPTASPQRPISPSIPIPTAIGLQHKGGDAAATGAHQEQRPSTSSKGR
ncbi:hypothetical protein ACSSS7_006228 [Eimeria intestinalis]